MTKYYAMFYDTSEAQQENIQFDFMYFDQTLFLL